MADSTHGTKGKKQGKSDRSKTVELAKKLAAAVIREHGLPDEIRQELDSAGVSPDVLERIGGRPGPSQNAPHQAKGKPRKR